MIGVAGMICSIAALALFVNSQNKGLPILWPALLTNLGIWLLIAGIGWQFFSIGALQEKLEIPSIILIYQNKQFQIHNKGIALTIWGTQVGNNGKIIEQQGRIIVPGAYYYLPAAHIDQQIATALGQNGIGYLPLELYLKDHTDKKITVKFLLGAITTDGVVTINSQMLDVTDGW